MYDLSCTCVCGSCDANGVLDAAGRVARRHECIAHVIPGQCAGGVQSASGAGAQEAGPRRLDTQRNGT